MVYILRFAHQYWCAYSENRLAQMADNVNGFQGAVAGLSLTDVIQLKGHNKYTGCITVIYGNSEGVIYFADGEIIHAVQGNDTGEEAIYQIIKWPGGNFNIHPEMTSNVCTIHYRTDFLLMEALRRLDEERAGVAPSEAGSGPSVTPRRTMSKVAARLQDINGVTYAVLLDKEGNPLQDTSMEAVALAAKGLFLAKTGNQLGELMGLGDIKAAAIHTRDFHMLMYDSKQHYLSIAVKPEFNLDTVEGEIKSALMPGK
jgi:predicted regulator of Ras-like GTPase activity (Roadblock/LC7/MglB family)